MRQAYKFQRGGGKASGEDADLHIGELVACLRRPIQRWHPDDTIREAGAHDAALMKLTKRCQLHP
jgi:hypothetical protein